MLRQARAFVCAAVAPRPRVHRAARTSRHPRPAHPRPAPPTPAPPTPRALLSPARGTQADEKLLYA